MSWHYRSNKYQRYKRRRQRVRRIKAFLLVAVVVIALAGGFMLAVNKRDLPMGTIKLTEKLSVNDSHDVVAWPSRGQAALGTLRDGVMVKSYEEERSHPMASITKVVTALAVLEKAPLSPGDTGIEITLDESDEELFREYIAKDGSVTNVIAGEKINQYQAIQAMMLPSSNNISDTLVRRVFGSVDEYVKYANEMLQRYGLEHTRVGDASGFSPQSVSTPAELIAIGQKALSHPVLAEISAQQNAELPMVGVVPNYNRLITQPNVSGIKIGNTDEAGWCVLFSASHTTSSGEDRTVIGAILGADNPDEMYADASSLLLAADVGLEPTVLVKKGEVVGEYETLWGAESEVIAREDIVVPFWQSVSEAKVISSVLAPPNSAGQEIGSLEIASSSEKSVPVVLKSDISEPHMLWRLRLSLNSMIFD